MDTRYKINHCQCVGYLTCDPKLTYTPNGKAVCNFKLRIEYPDRKGRKHLVFMPIEAWGDVAEVCSRMLGKDSYCAVKGELRKNFYKTKVGENHYIHDEIKVNLKEFEVLSEQLINHKNVVPFNNDNGSFSVNKDTLINLCPYAGGYSKCKKKKRLGCSYVLSGCYFDDVQVIFEDDDGYED